MFYRALRYQWFCRSCELGLVMLYERSLAGTVHPALRRNILKSNLNL